MWESLSAWQHYWWYHYTALWLLFFPSCYNTYFFPHADDAGSSALTNMALLTAAVETSLSIYIFPWFPAHCNIIDGVVIFLLSIYYLLVKLALRKSASGTNHCSSAEVAESPALQQWRSRIPLPQSAWTPSGKAEAFCETRDIGMLPSTCW